MDNFSYHYPLMMIIKTTYIYKIFQVVVTVFACSFFYAIFWRIYTHSVIDWLNNDVQDVYNDFETFYSYPDYGFIDWESENQQDGLIHDSDTS
jgi:hypothetical protein